MATTGTDKEPERLADAAAPPVTKGTGVGEKEEEGVRRCF